ncbi:PREDICTED: uncharacterized protein LOC106107429 [Papilio polytes]|uniref:uncharacterized protein LOC106107429 n=1 Tax=Papilio polytes TaxID=76194 RepID=UPI000675E493|nr:PREDICTED: uncharacterized protein LOC106107429 [Papilio polytes]
MWYTWTVLLLVSCALVAAEGQAEAVAGAQTEAPVTATPGPTATPRAPSRSPPRTLDRQAAELAWRSWLQSPESGNPNAPARRITTKSLFITPLVCPKGQRLDRNGCVQVVTVDKNEHERILLEHLNALFTSAPGGSDVQYDYGDEEPGPLQLSIPIGYDAQAAPLQSQDQGDTGQDLNYVKIDKKGDDAQTNDASIEAELELLKLQQGHNNTTGTKGSHVVSQNALTNFLAYHEKPKRDSPMINSSEIETLNSTDVGQKEEVFGHVAVDPVLYDTSYQNQQLPTEHEIEYSSETSSTDSPLNAPNDTTIESSSTVSNNATKQTDSPELKKENDNSKLNPEHDYSDIGEAIKIISRFAEVTTDDNFAKDKSNSSKEETSSILGTRTKLQYRRNKPKPAEPAEDTAVKTLDQISDDEKHQQNHPTKNLYFRYSWPNHLRSPQSDYPFKNVQDYWPGQRHVGGVYAMHENPRRHHHTYPHNYFRPRTYPYTDYSQLYPRLRENYSGLHRYPHRVARHEASPMRPHTNDQDLYTLLGLRHWFSGEGTSKR